MKDVATIQPLHALEVGAEHAFQIELDGKGNKGEAGAKLQLFAPDHVSTVPQVIVVLGVLLLFYFLLLLLLIFLVLLTERERAF